MLFIPAWAKVFVRITSELGIYGTLFFVEIKSQNPILGILCQSLEFEYLCIMISHLFQPIKHAVHITFSKFLYVVMKYLGFEFLHYMHIVNFKTFTHVLRLTAFILDHCRPLTQGWHRLEKYLNLESFLEKSLKIKSALKSTGKSLKSLEKSLNSTIFCRT